MHHQPDVVLQWAVADLALHAAAADAHSSHSEARRALEPDSGT